MTNHSSLSCSFDLDRPVIILRAQLTDRHVARAIERLLGDLWADDRLDVLDGQLLDWPPGSLAWLHRAPYNVPRLAALPTAFWHPAIVDSGHAAQPSRVLASLFPGFGPGASAICAICSTGDPEYARNALRHIDSGRGGSGPGDSGRGGSEISMTAISGRQYERFRRRIHTAVQATYLRTPR